jgi:hypothetical protein
MSDLKLGRKRLQVRKENLQTNIMVPHETI